MKNGNTSYCSHKCRRKNCNIICKNCLRPFEIKHFSTRVYCSWACVLQARKPKAIDKETLIQALLKFRHGERPNFAAIARQFHVRNGVMIAKWAQCYGIVDKNYKGPIVDGIYLPIPEDAIKSHPIKSTPFDKEYLKKRLFKRCEKDPITNCWVWTGHWSPQGYGRIRIARPFDKEIAVHTVAAHIWLDEPLPTTKLIFNKCRNRACFNPEHIIICKNRTELAKVCKKYKTQARGEKNGRTTITLETALDIRDALILDDEAPIEIARRLGVKKHIVWAIKHRKTWKYIWKMKHDYEGLCTKF